jgi:hypothetical protein
VLRYRPRSGEGTIPMRHLWDWPQAGHSTEEVPHVLARAVML